jgi:hypothetical protein
VVFAVLAVFFAFASAAAPVGSEGAGLIAGPPGEAGTAAAAPGALAASPFAGNDGVAGAALVVSDLPGVALWAPAKPAAAAKATATTVVKNVFIFVLGG